MIRRNARFGPRSALRQVQRIQRVPFRQLPFRARNQPQAGWC